MKNEEFEVDRGRNPDIRQILNQRRRMFLKGVAALTGSTGLLGYDPRFAAAEPPPETTKIRLLHNPFICVAPEYLAEDLLRLEGFDKIEYVEYPGDADPHQAVAAGRVDLTLDGSLSLVIGIDAGEHLAVLAGIHGGCYEFFANDRVKSIRDLKGKKVAIDKLGATDHVVHCQHDGVRRHGPAHGRPVGRDGDRDVRRTDAGVSRWKG